MPVLLQSVSVLFLHYACPQYVDCLKCDVRNVGGADPIISSIYSWSQSFSHHASLGLPVPGHWATLSQPQHRTAHFQSSQLVTLGMSEDISEMQTQYKGWWSWPGLAPLSNGHCSLPHFTNHKQRCSHFIESQLPLTFCWQLTKARILLYNISEDKHQKIPNKFLPKIPWLAATVILIEECFETLHSTISQLSMHKIRRCEFVLRRIMLIKSIEWHNAVRCSSRW